MADKIRKRVYFVNANDDLLQELSDLFNDAKFTYGKDYIDFYGYKERLAEVLRYARALGLKVREKV